MKRKSRTMSVLQKVKIRRAIATDREQLGNMVKALANHLKRPLTYEALERLKCDAFGTLPPFDTWIAEVDSSIVGYAITTYDYWTLYAARALHLNNLFVLPEYRRQGVGKTILFHLCKLAVDSSCAGLKFEVISWDTEAIGFYERLGVKRSDNYLSYSLKGEDLEQIVAYLQINS
ncbi:MAG TPA: hypothetical protein DCE56_38280 [Cyanobacteria bacterium UBA8553]|nr:hypothetical protein [Cyanobacteria bacterium UBA8553]